MFTGGERLGAGVLADGGELASGFRVGGEVGTEFGEARDENGAFAGGRWTRRGEPKNCGEPCVVGGGVDEGPLRHDAGGFDVGRIVERDESVQRRIGARDLDGADLAGAGIEECRRADDPAPKHVETAAVELVAVAWGVGFLSEGGFFPNARRLVGLHRGASALVDQEARGGEGLIANHPRRETIARAAGEEAIFRVMLVSGRGDARRLTIRGARDDEAVEGFGVPAALEVFGREPIEQFGVRGAFALHAEIFGGFDEASPEERLPRAIDGGASGERIGRRDQPTGQIEAIETGLGR